MYMGAVTVLIMCETRVVVVVSLLQEDVLRPFKHRDICLYFIEALYFLPLLHRNNLVAMKIDHRIPVA